MNNSEWMKLQSAIRLCNISIDKSISQIEESHYGCFLALIDNEGKIVKEIKKILSEETKSISKTIDMIISDIKKEKLDISNLSINLCVIKDAVYLRNPMEWDMNKDGVCFQWGNNYIGFYMPYEVSRMGGDKVRILDKLCSLKTNPSIFSSAWRLPEGLIYSIKVDWYK
ncbi:MAG: hypothetical protein WC755_02095 [Candidatus Woesearchaeota archaeon]|jgi:hypothetical protein